MEHEAFVDTALQRIHARADENADGFTSHAPMVIDALVALDRADRIAPFLDAYLDNFPPALEESEAAADVWSRAIDEADEANDWRDVIDPALSRLAPALFAAATHGLIRVAHAVRMLERKDTPVRRRELARAFAYWDETGDTRLPGVPGSAPDASQGVAELIDGLEVVPNERRNWGLFTEGAAVLADHAPFIESTSRLAIPERVDGADLSAVTQAMLPLYFESPLLRIAYIHTITAPSALRLVADHVGKGTLRDLYAYGVQAVAALHAISKLPTERAASEAASALAGDVEELKTRAADTLEEHVIKFTEACLREQAETGDARFRLAAADAVIAEETRASAKS